MYRRLVMIYARRIVNVNVNIVLAGLLALAPTLAVVHLVERMLASGFHPNKRLHISDQALITGVTFVADLIFDVSIYYALHWLANHWNRKGHDRIEDIADAAAENVPFFKDATKVQFERMVLSPLLYLIFLGGQFLLMTVYDVRPVVATAMTFVAGISCTRALHTLWMLREERLRKTKCWKCGGDVRGLDPAIPCPKCGSGRVRTSAVIVAPPNGTEPASNGKPRPVASPGPRR